MTKCEICDKKFLYEEISVVVIYGQPVAACPDCRQDIDPPKPLIEVF